MTSTIIVILVFPYRIWEGIVRRLIYFRFDLYVSVVLYFDLRIRSNSFLKSINWQLPYGYSFTRAGFHQDASVYYSWLYRCRCRGRCHLSRLHGRPRSPIRRRIILLIYVFPFGLLILQDHKLCSSRYVGYPFWIVSSQELHSLLVLHTTKSNTGASVWLHHFDLRINRIFISSPTDIYNNFYYLYDGKLIYHPRRQIATSCWQQFGNGRIWEGIILLHVSTQYHW